LHDEADFRFEANFCVEADIRFEADFCFEADIRFEADFCFEADFRFVAISASSTSREYTRNDACS
jgi:hypothetical protein